MTQSEIDRAVARRTGESTARIRRMGFVLLPPPARRRGRPARCIGQRPQSAPPAVPADPPAACPE